MAASTAASRKSTALTVPPAPIYGTRRRPDTPFGAPSLAELERDVRIHRWRGMRSCSRNVGQLDIALSTLEKLTGLPRQRATLADITPDHVRRAVLLWSEIDKISAASILVRLATLSAIGVRTSGCRPRLLRNAKWWLTPERHASLVAWLRRSPPPFPTAQRMADYIDWTCFTGLRVEETLRLRWADITWRFSDPITGEAGNFCEMQVPGTKTATCEATLAIGDRAVEVLKRRRELMGGDDAQGRVFGEFHYSPHLQDDWNLCRAYLGVSDHPMATLKALRRTAARYFVNNGMPLEFIRDYLRHTDIQTTMGYLRLTGGYSTAEQRKWL